MDIGSIRRENMLKLIASFRTQSDFADAICKPPSYISQIKKGSKPNGDSISMGSEFARDIERALGLVHGWMDRLGELKDQDKVDLVLEGDHVSIGSSSAYPLVPIRYLDIKASCGAGYINEDYPSVHTQTFSVEFLRANDLPVDGRGLVLMHACSASMGYTIPHGTLMLVNTNENEFDNFANNKIYVFQADGEMICKRAIKNLDGSIVLKSDNSDKDTYPDQLINKDSFTHFNLYGRVRYTFIQY